MISALSQSQSLNDVETAFSDYNVDWYEVSSQLSYGPPEYGSYSVSIMRTVVHSRMTLPNDVRIEYNLDNRGYDLTWTNGRDQEVRFGLYRLFTGTDKVWIDDDMRAH